MSIHVDMVSSNLAKAADAAPEDAARCRRYARACAFIVVVNEIRSKREAELDYLLRQRRLRPADAFIQHRIDALLGTNPAGPIVDEIVREYAKL